MIISNNDGKLNKDIIPAKDTLINANTLVYLGRNNYSKDEIDQIMSIKSY